jgi:hypothetical protein
MRIHKLPFPHWDFNTETRQPLHPTLAHHNPDVTFSTMAHQQSKPSTGSAVLRDVADDYVLVPASDSESGSGVNTPTGSEQTVSITPSDKYDTAIEAADKKPEAVNTELVRQQRGLTDGLPRYGSLK